MAEVNLFYHHVYVDKLFEMRSKHYYAFERDFSPVLEPSDRKIEYLNPECLKCARPTISDVGREPSSKYIQMK